MTVLRRIMLAGGIDLTKIPETHKIYYTANQRISPKKESLGSNIIYHYYDANVGEGIIVCKNPISIIGDGAFSCSNITGVKLPDSVVTIDHAAFYQCSELYSVEMHHVINIEYIAFAECPKLSNIIIGNDILCCNIDAFKDSNALPIINGAQCADTILIKIADRSILEYSVATNIKYICGLAFSNCTNLSNINIPTSINNVGSNVFSNCNALPVEDGIRYADIIAVEAVDKTLETYTLRSTTQFVSSGAFSGCKQLQNVIYPDSITSIGYRAFYGCNALTIGIIPDSVIYVEDPFGLCGDNLTSIYIGKNLTYINTPFASVCKNIESIIVDEYNQTYDSRENCNALIHSESNVLVQGCKTTVIPTSVTSIGEYAFNGNSGTDLIIPNSVTSLGGYAFQSYVGNTIVLSQNISSIGDAFDYVTLKGLICLGNITHISLLGVNHLEYLDLSHNYSIPHFMYAWKARIDKYIVPDDLYDEWITTAHWNDSYVINKIIKKSDWDAQQTTE